MEPQFYLIIIGFLTLTLFSSYEISASSFNEDSSGLVSKILSSSPLDDDSSTEYLTILKDELQNLRMDLTKAFVEDHTRKKRETFHSGLFNYEVKLDDQAAKSLSFKATLTSNMGQSTAIFEGSTVIFQSNGLYKLIRKSTSVDAVKISSWKLPDGDTILTTFQWEDRLFILTSNKNGSYSQLFTFKSNSGKEGPISRQHIRNQGHATSAQFFNHGKELYLVIAVDNEVHTLTSSPMYRWAGTYMDQIHEIQTRGATAVESFTIGSFKYIAIAQREDSTGNAEVGTLLVRMYRGGEIERFQLLWSLGPVSLKYIPFLKEHFLIVGQPKNSIVYWFGGFDFLHWQSLDDFPSNEFVVSPNVYLDGFVWEGEPILLAGTEKEVNFFTRTTSGEDNSKQQLSSASKLTKTSTIFIAKSGETILDAKILQDASSKDISVALTIHSSTTRAVSLRILPLKIVREEIPESQIKDSGDKLSQCMITLDSILTTQAPIIKEFNEVKSQILTVNKEWTYAGKIRTAGHVFVSQEESSHLGTVEVKPVLTSLADTFESSPSKIFGTTERQVQSFTGKIRSQLGKLLLRSRESEITGQLTFTNALEIDQLQAPSSNTQLQTLNGHSWDTLENDVLLANSSKTQLVSGEWEVNNLNADSVRIQNGFTEDFLFTKCDSDITQNINGHFEFKRNLEFDENLIFDDSATINDIEFSNIAFKTDSSQSIAGYKHASFINGGTATEINKWNNVKLAEWYDATLKTQSLEDQIYDGTLKFTQDISATKLKVEDLNNQNWNEFTDSVLLDIEDQTIRSELNFQNVKINHLATETINDDDISQILSTTSNQHITSEITVASTLRMRKNLNSAASGSSEEDMTINGIRLTDAVNDQEDAIITGPIEFQRLTVFKNIHMDDGLTINNIDISEAAKLRKKYIYFGQEGEEIIFTTTLEGNVQSNSLTSNSLNKIAFDEIKSAFWSSEDLNSIENDFDLSRAKEITIENDFNTGTLNGLNLETDIVTTNKENEQIFTNLKFYAPIIVKGDIEMKDLVEINNIDFSEMFNNEIVQTNNAKDKIFGIKTFKDDLIIDGGLKVGKINGISLENDLVFLSSSSSNNKQQEISGTISFEDELFTSGANIGSNVNVQNGLVNGINLANIGKVTAYKDETKIIDSDLIFSKLLKVEDLQVDAINGIGVNEVISHVINLNEQQTLNIPLTIEDGSITFEDNSEVLIINGILLSEYLPKVVNRHSITIINGTKTFKQVEIDKNLHCTSANGINLQDIQLNGFSKTNDQEISGAFVIQEAEIEHIKTDLIGGVPVSDFVRIDKDTKVTSNVEFLKKIVSNDNVKVDGLLNGYNIEQLAEGLKVLKGNRQFKKLSVDGNLSWKVSNEDLKGFSFLLNQAVTIDTPQKFTKKITFENGFEADTIDSKKWINNINLLAIQEDAVQLDEETVFTGAIIFSNDLEVLSGSAKFTKLDTSLVNGIRLSLLDRLVVRKDTNKVITGVKTFENGFLTQNLQILGTIDNIFPKDLVTINDSRVIKQLTFIDVDVLENLDFHSLENVDLVELLLERITKDQSHKVIGDIIFENDVIVNDCSVNSINGIEPSDLLLTNSETTQTISGSKSFTKLIINSQLQNVKINGFDFNQINAQALKRDENIIIKRPVTFVNSVHVSDLVNVSTHINTFEIEEITEAFADKLTDIKETVNVNENTRETTLALIESLKQSIEDIPGWFDYLEFQQDLNNNKDDDADGSFRFRVEHSISPDNEMCTIFFHKRIDGSTKCGLPALNECKNNARAIEIFDVDKLTLMANRAASIECDGLFEVKATSGSVYILHNEVASFNPTCNKHETGVTNIYRLSTTGAMSTPKHRFNFQSTSDGHPLATFSLAQLNIGFVSDTKAFTFKGIDYLIIAQYFDPITNSHSTKTLIYKVTDGTLGLELLQGIESHGAYRLSLDFVDSKWILVIVNTEKDTTNNNKASFSSSSSSSCNAQSAIYVWNEVESQFIQIKRLKDVNPNDVVSLSIWNGNDFEENFIGFSEKRTTIAESKEGENIGKISIYRYNRNKNSYSLYQIIDTTQPINSLAVLNTQAFTYLVSTGEDGLKFYKYLHAEGFRNELNVPVQGSQDTNGILWKNKILFPIAGGTRTILTKGIYSGKITDASKLEKANI